MTHWHDIGDAHLCPICGYETRNPNILPDTRCPKCGFKGKNDNNTYNREIERTKRQAGANGTETPNSHKKRGKNVKQALAIAGGTVAIYSISFLTLAILRRLQFPISNDAIWIGNVIIFTGLIKLK